MRRMRTLLLLGGTALLAGYLPVITAHAAPTCFGLAPTIVGTAGPDELQGGPGTDVILAKGGDDTIDPWGDLGDDYICGNGGNDRVDNWAGADHISGGSGNDTVTAQEGLSASDDAPDVINGGAGDDYLIGGVGADRISGAAGNDDVRGRYGDDRLIGGIGDDALWDDVSEAASDLLRGGSGNDWLWSTGGADTLTGEDGDDTLYARDSAGDDTLDGGTHIVADKCTSDEGDSEVNCELEV